MSGGEDLPPVRKAPRLSDGTVMLRELYLKDALAIQKICQDPQNQQGISLPAPYTEQDAYEFLNGTLTSGWSSGERHTFAVVRVEAEEQLLGTIDLHQFRAGTAEVGINIGEAARGTGTSLRAVQLLVGYAFGRCELDFLYWLCFVPNWASRKLALKSGFRFEGLLRGYGDYRGVSSDMWLFSLSRVDHPEFMDSLSGVEVKENY